MQQTLEMFSILRRGIVHAIKQEGPLAIEELADRLGVTYEAARQQVRQLQTEGWVDRGQKQDRDGRPGRPRTVFGLTFEGDHLFTKNYADLAVEIVDTIATELEPEALKKILAALTEARVKRWQPMLEGKSLIEKLHLLKEIYHEDDPFTVVETHGNGSLRLVERNCPFLDVARRRPALCSITVSTLTRLLGYRVVREEKFQNGDGCCAFRVLTDQPVDADRAEFQLESA
ncbi:MAG: MarR family transcriptional regulator [Acidobacteriota bacterium]